MKCGNRVSEQQNKTDICDFSRVCHQTDEAHTKNGEYCKEYIHSFFGRIEENDS